MLAKSKPIVKVYYYDHYVHLLIVRCPQLSPPAHGQVDDGGRVPGDVATYSCDEGFLLASSNRVGSIKPSETAIVCTPSGLWTMNSIGDVQCAGKLLGKGSSFYKSV